MFNRYRSLYRAIARRDEYQLSGVLHAMYNEGYSLAGVVYALRGLSGDDARWMNESLNLF